MNKANVIVAGLVAGLAAGEANAEYKVPLVPLTPAERDMGFEEVGGDAIDNARTVIKNKARTLIVYATANTRLRASGKCPGIEHGKYVLSSNSTDVVEGAPVAVVMIPTFSRVGENGTWVIDTVAPSTPGASGKYELACVRTEGKGEDAKIVDVANGAREMPVGEAGELIIKGPQVMKGYWNRPEESSRALRQGWLHTGDMARMDEDGYFYITGKITKK